MQTTQQQQNLIGIFKEIQRWAIVSVTEDDASIETKYKLSF